MDRGRNKLRTTYELIGDNKKDGWTYKFGNTYETISTTRRIDGQTSLESLMKKSIGTTRQADVHKSLELCLWIGWYNTIDRWNDTFRITYETIEWIGLNKLDRQRDKLRITYESVGIQAAETDGQA